MLTVKFLRKVLEAVPEDDVIFINDDDGQEAWGLLGIIKCGPGVTFLTLRTLDELEGTWARNSERSQRLQEWLRQSEVGRESSPGPDHQDKIS